MKKIIFPLSAAIFVLAACVVYFRMCRFFRENLDVKPEDYQFLD